MDAYLGLVKLSVILLLSLIFSTVARAGHEGVAFDDCVNRLYAFGGLSKDRARRDCLRGLSEDLLQCQNKKFLIDFNEPEKALRRCEAQLERVRLSDYEVYAGTYETPPVSKTKKTVCSITVNSADERETFRKVLDPAEYSWVELLPQNAIGSEERFIPRDDLWIKKAYREKTRCDVVVISGHFASTFLGSSGFEVRLEDLTKYSCENDCRELFESVRQVYLFGCNTLSEKTSDSRSISEYRNILIVDGVSPHLAQRVAALRYTIYGQSLRSEVRKVFSHAEQIFGYAGPGPTGPNVRATLQTYLKSAYAKGISQSAKEESFKRTLGRTGMLSVSGLPKGAATCRESRAHEADPRLRTAKGIRDYISKYGRDLPVAAFDLIREAQDTHALSDQEVSGLLALVEGRFAGVPLKKRQRLLCPQILTERPDWTPPGLNCKDDQIWLNNGRSL